MADTPAKSSTGGAKRNSTGGTAKRAAPAKRSAPKKAAPSNTTVAKSRFNAALEEARAGAAALGAEARSRASGYGSTAMTKGEDYAGQLKARAGELAVEGKAKASEALSGLAKLVGENAGTVDEKLGSKYGDYARSTSRSLQDTATALDNRSVEQLGEDAREMVRKSPGMAVGLAALAGFMFARLFRGGK
jgi:ElaB/YqjD/DUF883 family membrane-anchored ribosome-binding protein